MKISRFTDVYYSKYVTQEQALPALLHICFITARVFLVFLGYF